MKKVLSIVGTIVVIGFFLFLAYLKWWNVFGQEKMGGSCSGRAGCRSFYCLAHEKVGDVEQKSAGYCTDKCESDTDCLKDMKCVVPSAEALDDLPRYGRPTKLCERVK
ncbi:MAG TPA: hypothetical protein VLB44_19960 [Kofleriaceae bacterium]|nr:hypothetical protein [Kofleriaceae bacterium]